ncbi:hypothetical protein AAVH_11639 [Aphelenchoides avenae]|nr:hypothetical protein AAVH_11639 [Aphelenchus avenae]
MASLSTGRSLTSLPSTAVEDSELRQAANVPFSSECYLVEYEENPFACGEPHLEDNELDCLEQLSSYTAESFDLDEYMAALDADDLDTANDLGVPFAASAYDLNCSMTTVHGDHLSYYQVPDMNNGPVCATATLTDVPSQYQLPEMCDYSSLYSAAALCIFKSFHEDIGGFEAYNGTTPDIAESQYVFEMN